MLHCTRLVVCQATGFSEEHLRVVVDAERRLSMGADMRFEAFANHLGR